MFCFFCNISMQAEQSGASGELVTGLTANSTHHLLHLVPEFAMQGLAAQLIAPEGIQQPAVLHQFLQSPMASEVGTQ